MGLFAFPLANEALTATAAGVGIAIGKSASQGVDNFKKSIPPNTSSNKKLGKKTDLSF